MFDLDFLKLSKEELSFKLCSGENPLDKSRLKGDSSGAIMKMINIIYATVIADSLDINKHTVYIPDTDLVVKISKWTTISELTDRISGAINENTEVQSEQLSNQKIQTAIHHYLCQNGYLELRESPYDTRNKSYYATDKGEDCGIRNFQRKTDKNKHIVSYSCYMQVCIIRKLHDILAEKRTLKSAIRTNDSPQKNFPNAVDYVLDDLKKKYIDNQYSSGVSSSAPINDGLTTDEREIIKKYRMLNTHGKKAVNTVIDSCIATMADNKKNRANKS